MDINEIKDIVEENYGINIKSISKVKNSYNVKADEGEYCIVIFFIYIKEF